MSKRRVDKTLTRRRMVAYIRVSKGRENMISPDIQLTAIETWADRNNVEIVRVISDTNHSGRKFEKRQVPQIVTEIEDGAYEGVVLWKWSRWGRNSTMSGAYLVRVEAAGGAVHSATEDIDPETIIGRFTRAVLLAIAEMESDMKSEGWKETHDYRRAAHLPHNGAPRFGYVYATVDGQKKYVIDPQTANTLKALYERFNSGISLRTLVMDLNAQGITTVGGSIWTVAGLGYMLDTGFGAGWIREKSEDARKKYGQSKTIDTFDIWREGSHQKIIDPDEFQTYKLIRLANALKAPRSHKPAHAFSGLTRCGICNGASTANSGGPGSAYVSWKCKTHSDSGDTGCKGTSLSDKRIEKIVMAWITERAVGEWSPGEAETVAEGGQQDIASIENRIAELGRELDLLVTLWTKGKIDEPRYDARKAKLDTQMEEATGDLRRARKSIESRQMDPRPYLQAIADNWITWLDAEEKNVALRQVIGKVMINDGPWGPEKVTIVPLWEMPARELVA